jgi:membrane protein YdbS with pleckstrin-like domain
MASKISYWIVLAIAITLGLAIFWVDSRPNWDDTGITALMILAVTTVLGMTIPRRAWSWALAVGIWIPLGSILQHHGYTAILALIIAFAGAYVGALVRYVASSLV